MEDGERDKFPNIIWQASTQNFCSTKASETNKVWAMKDFA
jgi:hypothetical protein